MTHAHSHPENCGHQHGHADAAPRALAIALVLTASFFVAEIVGGLMSNSLALLADAGHMFTDLAALALSLFVAWFSRQPATPEKTYGYLRWEILAAFLNGAALLLVSVGILWEATSRLANPESVGSSLMLFVALGGLVVNGICAYLLHGAHTHSLNARGAYLHVMGDLLGSVGTVAAALIIRQTGWLLADPIASIAVTLLIVRSAWRLVRESVDVLLEATPSHISLGAVRQALIALPGVASVHDLHVWTVTSGVLSMSAHLVVPEPDGHARVLSSAQEAMARFGIHHTTVQIEVARMCAESHP